MSEALEVGDPVIVRNVESPFLGLEGEVLAIAGSIATVSHWTDQRLAVVPLVFKLTELERRPEVAA